MSIVMLLVGIIAFALLSGVTVLALIAIGDVLHRRRQTGRLIERITQEEPLFKEGVGIREKLTSLESFLDEDRNGRENDNLPRMNLPAKILEEDIDQCDEADKAELKSRLAKIKRRKAEISEGFLREQLDQYERLGKSNK